MTQLAKAIVVVAGAAHGPGCEAARALAPLVGHLALLDVNPTQTEALADALRADGASVSVHLADLTNKLATQTALYQIIETHGRVDGLVNAAHITPRSDALTMDEWEWDRTMNVIAKSAFITAQTAARAMQATGGGFIINVWRTTPTAHAGVQAARAALRGLTQALAPAWQTHNIHVVGLEDTPDLPARVVTACRRALE